MSATTILPSTSAYCDGCKAICHTDELNFCFECSESYCGRMSRNCACSCSRVKIAAYDAIHGAGAYEREAERELSDITLEEFAGKVLSLSRGDA